uniref:Nucleoplasmin ATPase-like n=1 Tax=Sinocyclocheilus rhinocerous TaxID=307959 RepID=A0A673LZZ3_9TELE
MSKTEKPLSTLWGCELNESNKEESFKTDDTNHQHQLALRTMCLGHTAKDEFNIVELVTGEGNSSARAVPIATLHAKSMPTVNLSGLDLHPPVTFRLKRGSGPVYVGAEHVARKPQMVKIHLKRVKEGDGRRKLQRCDQMWMGSGTFPEGRCRTFVLGSQISHHGPIVAKLPVNKTVGGESKLVIFSEKFICARKYDWVACTPVSAVI